jgi:hypothetical protein
VRKRLPTARMLERGLRDSEDLRNPALSPCMRGGERLATEKWQLVNGAEKCPLFAAPLLRFWGGGGRGKRTIVRRKISDAPTERTGLFTGWIEIGPQPPCPPGLRHARRTKRSSRHSMEPYGYWGEIASGVISADMSGNLERWFRVKLGELDQWITLVARPRHFGGHQWYFLCPTLKSPVSVLWNRFRRRQGWGRQVAYQSQFCDETDRAHLGKSCLKNRLIAELDPDEWDLPPKPKWMRWATYDRHVARYDHHEAVLDSGILAAAAKFLGE